MATLKIHQDSFPMNPRTEWDNLGTIAYKHGRYTLGEEEMSDPIDWLETMLNLNPKYVYSNDRLTELEDKFFEKYIGHKIYLYDHSGISVSTKPFSCPWDSGQVGYIYVSKEKVREEYGVKRISPELRTKILSYLDGEIETFNQYLNNDVYGFTIEDEEGNVLESVGGFYGDDFVENGMADHIDSELLGMSDTELIEHIKQVDVEYA
jgi:hypothetical protein